MLSVCVIVASVAMFSGISGAALLIPVFLIGFPLLGVPRLTTVEAVATSLLLGTSGFGTGVARYARMRLADLRTVRSLLFATVPLGVTGALVAQVAPVQLLRLGYGIAMIGLAVVIARGSEGEARGGLAAVPWNLIVWVVPGAVVGAALGTRLQGRVSERASRRFFATLFGAIGVTLLVAFTLLRSRFG